MKQLGRLLGAMLFCTTSLATFAATEANRMVKLSCESAKPCRECGDSHVGIRWLSGRMIDQYGYTPVFIAYGIMPLIAAGLVLFAMGPLRPLPEFQNPLQKRTN